MTYTSLYTVCFVG